VLTVFGIDEVEIQLEGTSYGDHASLRGRSPQAPNIPFEVTLKKLPA
jgi:hypothetical protein